MEENKQKYYMKYHDKIVTIVHKFTLNKREFLIVEDEDQILHICNQDSLIKEENTCEYKRKQRIQSEIEEIEKNKEEIIKKLKKKAVDSLAMRIKINIAFGKTDDNASIGLMIAKEIEKLIDKEEIKIDKEKDAFDF